MSLSTISRPMFLLTLCFTLLLAASLVGCGQKPAVEGSAEPGTVVDAEDAGLSTDDLVVLEESKLPDNLADSIIMLETVRDNIDEGLSNNDIGAAHGPLHEVGHLLEHVQQLVTDSNLGDDQKMAAGEAVETLFDKFGAIDELIHDDKPVDYSLYRDDIDSAMSTLSELK